MTQILVISDTHVNTINQLPERMLDLIGEAELVVHCGDFTSGRLVEELKSLSRRFIGVYGNADKNDVRPLLPADTIFEVEGRRIAVVHPYWGGFPDGLEKKLITRFKGVDAILFGHTHESCNIMLNNILLFNPGQGYRSSNS